jgi:excisionase family DNA binding protein
MLRQFKFPRLHGMFDLAMRIFPRQRVDPVLVTRESAADLLSLDLPTIDQLIERGDLPITKTVGKAVLIPYRSLLIYAGVARWRFQEIVDA